MKLQDCTIVAHPQATCGQLLSFCKSHFTRSVEHSLGASDQCQFEVVALASYAPRVIRNLMVPDETDNHDESFCVNFYLTKPDAGLARLPKNLQIRPVLNRVD